jgi:hypothetical protein
MIREKRGIQRDRSQIRVSKTGRVHNFVFVKNDRYPWNEGEERKLVGYVPNKCVGVTTIIFLYSFEVILWHEEYYNE